MTRLPRHASATWYVPSVKARRKRLSGSRRSGRLVPLLAGLALGSAVLVPGPASAAQSPCPSTAGNYFATYTSSSSTSGVVGSRAKLEYANPDLCGNDTTDSGISAAWLMYQGTGLNQFAQVGYGQWGDASSYYPDQPGLTYFAQYGAACAVHGTCTSADDPFPTWFSFTNPIAGTQIYTVDTDASNSNHVRMAIDGTTYFSTGYDPAGDWSTGRRTSYGGETQQLESDVPGTAAQKVSVYFLQRRVASGWGYYPTAVALYQADVNSNRYHAIPFTPADGAGFKIYTDPLS